MPASLEAVEHREWDAIVVGAGAVGGLAALLLTRAGLDVLLLDAGWRPGFWQSPYRSTVTAGVRMIIEADMLRRLPRPVLASGRTALRALGRIRQPMQSQFVAWQMGPGYYVDDRDSPYVTDPDAPFLWLRSWQIGGRMVVPGHGRQYYRMSAADFTPADGHPGWPLEAAELDPWYDMVEAELGLRGRLDGLPDLPDSRIAHQAEYTPADRDLLRHMQARWPGIQAVLGRSAPPLPAVARAGATGRLVCRQGALVREIRTAPGGAANGVAWHDRAGRRVAAAGAPLVFLGASALESARILMMSRSRSGHGLGGGSGVLGAYLMDHVSAGGSGRGPPIDGPVGLPAQGHCLYVPRLDQRDGEDGPAPYSAQIYRWAAGARHSGLNVLTFSGMAPRRENRIRLHPDRRDAFGAPILHIDCRISRAEHAVAAQQARAIAEIAEACGVTLDRLDRTPLPPGSAIHECGVARMGADPANSVLDPFNQCWEAPGLYLTDAASFPSLPLRNPTLTSMALTARAVDHALRARGVRPAAAAESVRPGAAPLVADSVDPG